MTVNWRRGPWGGGLFEKQAGAGPASSLSHLPWLPWSTGPASLLRYAYTRPADCAFFLSPLGISAFLPSCQGSGSGEDQDSSLGLASVYFLSLISSPSRFWLVYLSSPGLWPNLLYLRTFALAISLPGMLDSHGQLFLFSFLGGLYAKACSILVPWLVIEPTLPTVEAQGSHCATGLPGKFLASSFLNFKFKVNVTYVATFFLSYFALWLLFFSTPITLVIFTFIY